MILDCSVLRNQEKTYNLLHSIHILNLQKDRYKIESAVLHNFELFFGYKDKPFVFIRTYNA